MQRNVDRARGTLDRGNTVEGRARCRRSWALEPSLPTSSCGSRPTSGSPSAICGADRSSWPSTPPTGARSAATRWRSTTRSFPEFHKHGAELLGISVDGAWCHEAFAQHRHLHFPLLADFEPKGAVAQSYGAYREAEGVCERALFVIDRQGRDLLELLLANRRQSRRRRHPGRAGKTAETRKTGHGHAQSSSHAA